MSRAVCGVQRAAFGYLAAAVCIVLSAARDISTTLVDCQIEGRHADSVT